MVVFPNAKINLGLRIVAKRPDGYHDLLSCFYPVGWTDALEILPSSTMDFTATGLPIPGDGNLCLRAYRLLQGDWNLPPVRMHLHKVIPIGAGLGGGSADGAFALKALNQLFSLGLTPAQLEAYARQLGSDCAFFIRNQPVYCTGRGDQFEEIMVNLAGRFVVLVNPGIHVSTAEAYAGVRPRLPATDLKKVLQAPLDAWRETVQNDFEAQLAVKYPIIAQVKETLYHSGAVYASMTGSGSPVYGIFEQAMDLQATLPGYAIWQGALG